jgi:hypothetical protein
MNYSRFAICALLTAVVLVVGEFAFIMSMGGRLMAARQAAGLPEFVPQPMLSILEVVLTGTFITWLYVSIRPRFGAGPKTAAIAGIAAWGGLVLLSTVHTIGEGFGLPTPLLLTVAVIVLPIFVFSSVIGTALYRE